MEITITKKQLINAKASLEQLGQYVKGVKMSYAISYNLIKMKTEIQAIQDASKPSDAYVEFDKKRISILSEHAPKGADGRPEIVNGQYVVTDPVAFEKALEPVKKEFAKVIEERESQLKEAEELLKEEVSIDLRTLSLEALEKPNAVVPDAPGLAPLLYPLMEIDLIVEGEGEKKE